MTDDDVRQRLALLNERMHKPVMLEDYRAALRWRNMLPQHRIDELAFDFSRHRLSCDDAIAKLRITREAGEALLHELEWVNAQLDLMPDDYAEALANFTTALAATEAHDA